jgi:hypothetical protein
MALYKNYIPQQGFDKKMKRPSSTHDTTISNMMFGDNTPSKDYGKVKSKGGVTKANTVVSKDKTKKK